jgi:hypothetical protein
MFLLGAVERKLETFFSGRIKCFAWLAEIFPRIKCAIRQYVWLAASYLHFLRFSSFFLSLHSCFYVFVLFYIYEKEKKGTVSRDGG